MRFDFSTGKNNTATKGSDEIVMAKGWRPEYYILMANHHVAGTKQIPMPQGLH